MLVMRKKQQEALEKEGKKEIIEGILNSLPSVFPENPAVYDRTAMVDLIERGFDSARSYKIYGGRETALYIYLYIESGPDFTKDKNLDWIEDILVDDQWSPAEKMDIIYERLKIINHWELVAMDLDGALAAASKISANFPGEPARCQPKKTGLLVLVYETKNRQVISGKTVKISGRGTKLLPPKNPLAPPGAKSRYGRAKKVKVSGRGSVTDSNGIAQFLPIDPGSYSIIVEDMGAADLENAYISPDPVKQGVTLGKCPICQIPVTVGARPEIKLVWKFNNTGARGMKVSLGTNEFSSLTSETGATKWDGEPIEPQKYDLSIKSHDEATFEFYKVDQKIDGVPKVHLPAGLSTHEFKIVRQSWLKFEAVAEQSKGGPGNLEGVKLTLKWPEGSEDKDFQSVSGVKDIKPIPQTDGPATKCIVKSLQVPTEDTPGVFEFVDLRTT